MFGSWDISEGLESCEGFWGIVDLQQGFHKVVELQVAKKFTGWGLMRFLDFFT